MRVRSTRRPSARRRTGAAIVATAVVSMLLVVATSGTTTSAAPVNATIATSCTGRDKATNDTLALAKGLIGSDRVAVNLLVTGGDVPETAGLEQDINAAFNWAARMDQNLKDSPRAVAYFKGRGLSGQVAKQFGLGYAPEGWRSLASVFAHYDDPLLVESGLVISNVEDGSTEEKRYDRFRDRVMFPIRNIKGECIGFGGRVLGDDKPKYLNSPETPVFSKGRELYGLFEARNALREAGYIDATFEYPDYPSLWKALRAG